MMELISEYQENFRNARVYKIENRKYNVLVFDAETDYNGIYTFSDVDSAEDFSEVWVLKK